MENKNKTKKERKKKNIELIIVEEVSPNKTKKERKKKNIQSPNKTKKERKKKNIELIEEVDERNVDKEGIVEKHVLEGIGLKKELNKKIQEKKKHNKINILNSDAQNKVAKGFK